MIPKEEPITKQSIILLELILGELRRTFTLLPGQILQLMPCQYLTLRISSSLDLGFTNLLISQTLQITITAISLAHSKVEISGILTTIFM